MEAKKLHLVIVSPEKELFNGEATRVTLPGSAGVFTILAYHAPIVSSLKQGKIIYLADDGEKVIDIESGFVEMSDNNVSVCISI